MIDPESAEKLLEYLNERGEKEPEFQISAHGVKADEPPGWFNTTTTGSILIYPDKLLYLVESEARLNWVNVASELAPVWIKVGKAIAEGWMAGDDSEQLARSMAHEESFLINHDELTEVDRGDVSWQGAFIKLATQNDTYFLLEDTQQDLGLRFWLENPWEGEAFEMLQKRVASNSTA